VIETLLSLTSLPNAHAALAQLPIALATAALLFDAWGWAARGSRGFAHAAAALWVCAALSAGGAYLSGARAADALVSPSLAVSAAVAAHEEAALVAAVSLGVAAALRLVTSSWGRAPRLLRMLGGLAGAAALGLALLAGDRGVALVYRHGAGVASSALPPAAPETAAPACELPAGAAGGLRVPVAGRAELALEALAPDARLEVRLDLADFEGEAALVRRAQDGSGELVLRLGPTGALALLLRRGAEEQRLAEAVRATAPGPLELGLSLAGGQAQGWVDGIAAVQGPAELAPDAGALLFEGRGEARVLDLRLRPPEGDTASPPPAAGP
jgi:uncharacterized membrane protein